MSAQVKVGDVLMTDVADLVSIATTTAYGPGFGGEDIAEVNFRPRGNYVATAIPPNAPAVFSVQAVPIWYGEFSEIMPQSDGSITMHFRGHGHRLEDLDSMYRQAQPGDDDVEYPTVDLDEGWARAVALFGLDLTHDTFPTVPAFMDEAPSPDPIKLAEVASEAASGDGQKWAVWNKHLSFPVDDYSNPIIWDAPKDQVAFADSNYITHCGVLFVADAPGTDRFDWSTKWAVDSVATANFKPKSLVVDKRDLGLITGTEASALALGYLEQLKGRWLFTGSITVTSESQFPVWVPGVKAGQAMKLNGLRTSVGSFLPESETLFIIGKTDYRWNADGSDFGKDSLTLTPMGKVPRNVGEIIKGGAPNDNR